MDVRVILVIVGDENRLGVPHAERVQAPRCAAASISCRLGFSPGRQPSDRCTQSCSHCRVRLRLVERVKFHDAPGQLGVRALAMRNRNPAR